MARLFLMVLYYTAMMWIFTQYPSEILQVIRKENYVRDLACRITHECLPVTQPGHTQTVIFTAVFQFYSFG